MAKAVKKKTPKTHPKAHVITWIVFIALIGGLVLGYFVAQQKYMHRIGMISVLFSQRDTELNQIKSRLGKMNKVIKEGGKVWIMKNGDVVLLEKEVTLPDGTLVMASGKYMKPGEAAMMLKEGQAIDLNGNVVVEQQEAQF
jgi:ribosomal protein L16/L10AE